MEIVAVAVHSFKSVIVPNCPYCSRKHTHSEQTMTGEKRMSGCLIGEYFIEIQGRKPEDIEESRKERLKLKSQ